MNQIPDGLERELAPRDGRWCRMQARRDDRNPQHGAATIIDIGVSVSMPQATHRNQRKAPSVEWMGRIRDRDLFGPSILQPNRGVKKWDRIPGQTAATAVSAPPEYSSLLGSTPVASL